MDSVLGEVIFDAPGFAEEERDVLVGDFDELEECFHGALEFIGEAGVLLVLPGIAEGGESGLEEGEAVLGIEVEALEFFGEAPDLSGIHDGLGHGGVGLAVLDGGGYDLPERSPNLKGRARAVSGGARSMAAMPVKSLR
jgi:hypothetical protein